MTRWWRRRAIGPGLALTAVLAGGSAAADGICVICSGPDAIYSCRPDSGPARPGDARLGLLCITEIARTDGHQSCSVRRQQLSCDGKPRTVALVGDAPMVPPAVAAAPPGPQPGPETKPGPPDTVAELAKRTAAESKQQLRKATDVVEDAAKKTGGVVGDVARKTGEAAKTSWRCLASFFSDC